MTATIEETNLSTIEVPSVPCEYPWHERVGEGPAVWIVRFKVPQPCGCVVKRNPGFMCDACWTYRNTHWSGMIRCVHCGCITTDVMGNIESVERI